MPSIVRRERSLLARREESATANVSPRSIHIVYGSARPDADRGPSLLAGIVADW
jgi:hypothetical protein